VGAVCTPEEVWQMTDEMVVAQARWLPQYAEAVPAAERRLKSARVPTRDWDGAARLPVRSVEQMRIDRAARQETHMPDRQIVA
jgi:alpha-galactosidase